MNTRIKILETKRDIEEHLKKNTPCDLRTEVQVVAAYPNGSDPHNIQIKYYYLSDIFDTSASKTVVLGYDEIVAVHNIIDIFIHKHNAAVKELTYRVRSHIAGKGERCDEFVRAVEHAFHNSINFNEGSKYFFDIFNRLKKAYEHPFRK